MSRRPALQLLPALLHPERHARNGQLPQPAGLRRIAEALNYVAARQTKVTMVRHQNYRAFTGGSSAAVNVWPHAFRTGANQTGIEVKFGMARTPLTTSSVPTVTLRVRDLATNTSIVSEDVALSGESGSTTLVPDAINNMRITLEGLTPDTEYWLENSAVNGAAFTYMTVRGLPGRHVDVADNGIADPSPFVAEAPIYDTDIASLVEAARQLWRKNASQLLTWNCAYDEQEPANTEITSTSYTSIHAAPTSPFRLQTEFYGTRSRPDGIKVKLAVRARRSAGSGTADFRIFDGTNEVAITAAAITGSEAWFTTTGEISGTPTNWRLQARCSNGTTSVVPVAFCVWVYDEGVIPPTSTLLHFGSSGIGISVADRYLGPWEGSTAVTDEIPIIVPFDCELRNLQVRAGVAGSGAGTTTYTVRVNGVDTAITCTISMSASPYVGVDLSNTVSVVAGDRISLKNRHSAIVGGTAVQEVRASLEAVATGGSRVLSFSAAGGSPSTSVRYMPPYYNDSVAATTERPLLVPADGVLRNLRVRARTAPTGSGSITYTVRVNGVDTALTCTVSQGASPHEGSDVANTVAVSAHDRVSLAIQHSTAPSSNGADVIVALEYAATSDRLFFGTGTIGNPGGTAQRMHPWGLAAGAALDSAAVPYILMPFDGVLSNAFLHCMTPSGSGQTATINVMVNGAASGITISYAEGATSAQDIVNTAAVSAGDRVSVEVTTNGTVSGNDFCLNIDLEGP